MGIDRSGGMNDEQSLTTDGLTVVHSYANLFATVSAGHSLRNKFSSHTSCKAL